MMKIFLVFFLISISGILGVHDRCDSSFSVPSFPYALRGDTTNNTQSLIITIPGTGGIAKKGYYVSFRPTQDKLLLTVNLCNRDSQFNTMVYLFTECIGGIAQGVIAENEDYPMCGREAFLQYYVKRDVQYYVLITGDNLSSFGQFLAYLTLESDNLTAFGACPSPMNINLPYFGYHSPNNMALTKDSCIPDRDYKGIYYKFKGIGKTVTIRTCSELTQMNTFIGLHKADCDTCEGFKVDGCRNPRKARMDVFTDLNVEYIVTVGTTTGNGFYWFEIREYTASDQSTCEGARNMDVMPFLSIRNTNRSDVQRHPCFGTTDTYGFWFKYIGTGTPVLATTCVDSDIYDANEKTMIGVYSACPTANSAQNICMNKNDGFCGAKAQLVIHTLPSVEYYIYYGAVKQNQNVSMVLKNYVDPVNNYCYGATKITHLPFTHFAHSASSVMEGYTCDTYVERTRSGVWFSYYNDKQKEVKVRVQTEFPQTEHPMRVETFGSCFQTGCISGANSTLELTVRPMASYFFFVTAKKTPGFFKVLFTEVEQKSTSCLSSSINIPSFPYKWKGFLANYATGKSACSASTVAGQYFDFLSTTQHVFVHTCGLETNMATDLHIMTDCDTCYERASDYPDRCLRGNSAIEVRLSNATKVHVLVTARNSTVKNDVVEVIFTQARSQPNPTCEMALPAKVNTPVQTIAGVYRASYEGLRGAWYSYTSAGGNVEASTCNDMTAGPTRLFVFHNCSFEKTDPLYVVGENVSCNGKAVVRFEASVKTYYIFVASVNDQSPTFVELLVKETTIPSEPEPYHPSKGGNAGKIAGAAVGVVVLLGVIVVIFVVGNFYYNRSNPNVFYP